MFYGREDILTNLLALWGKLMPSLVTCRGRRRIGKSTLIAEFARRSQARFIKIEGLKPEPRMDNNTQLANFANYLALQSDAEKTPPENWATAFKRLDREINDNERTVMLLDEISWMGYFDPTFANAVKIAWDNLWKNHPRLVVVLCGSVSSWIKENIVDNSAFMGRRSGDFVIGELPLKECVKFWGAAAQNTASREILDILSITGGVPRYLEEINPGLSANENIKRMCFMPNGPLRVDFDEMFTDVITKQSALTGKVLASLVEGPKTLSVIAAEIDKTKNGNISAALARLQEAGFVAADPGKNPETGAPVREKKFRLKDNYSRFYLKYIAPVKDVIDAGAYEFVNLEQLEGWQTVLGLAFENLVVNHYREFLQRLGLENTLIVSAAPYHKNGNRKTRIQGCQIDLLLQTAHSLCLVEIKRRQELGSELIAEMEKKIASIIRPAGVSVRTALIYDGNLSPTVESGGYFNTLINIEEMLR